MKAGDEVVLILTGPFGLTSQSIERVLEVTEEGVWLDNGIGNNPTGPFVNGKMPPVMGTVLSIEEAK